VYQKKKNSNTSMEFVLGSEACHMLVNLFLYTFIQKKNYNTSIEFVYTPLWLILVDTKCLGRARSGAVG